MKARKIRPLRSAAARNALAEPQRRVERPLAALVRHQLQRTEQAALARIADQRVCEQALQPGFEARRLRLAVREQPTFVIEAQHLERRSPR